MKIYEWQYFNNHLTLLKLALVYVFFFKKLKLFFLSNTNLIKLDIKLFFFSVQFNLKFY